MSDQITATCLHHFSDAASWAYDYGHIFKTIDNLLWMNANNIEFVPMVWGFRVDTQQTLGVDITSCYLTQQQTDKVAGRVKCNGAQELTAQLGRLVNNLNVAPQYINTINEPYALKPSNPIHPVPVASSSLHGAGGRPIRTRPRISRITSKHFHTSARPRMRTTSR